MGAIEGGREGEREGGKEQGCDHKEHLVTTKSNAMWLGSLSHAVDTA